jgi:hypothetical protein
MAQTPSATAALPNFLPSGPPRGATSVQSAPLAVPPGTQIDVANLRHGTTGEGRPRFSSPQEIAASGTIGWAGARMGREQSRPTLAFPMETRQTFVTAKATQPAQDPPRTVNQARDSAAKGDAPT